MGKKKVLIFVDRDGTIIHDRKTQPRYYLGRQKNWKSKIKFIPYSIKGLKFIKENIPEAKIYMISNQPGIAIKEFPLATEKKIHEIFRYILKILKGKGVKIDGYQFCSKASLSYAKSRPMYTFNKKDMGNFDCIKPNPGMINSILKKEKLDRKDVKIYNIGDRISDIEIANNVKGFGILVPFANQPNENRKLKKIRNKKHHFAKNFLEAAEFIVKREN